MILLLSIVHIIVALLLILFVLIQDSKGDGVFGMGSGGGGSNQVLSSTGAANFLVKTTRTLVVVFAFTSIGLTYLTSKHGGSVTDAYVPPPAASAPAAPANGAAPKADASKPAADGQKQQPLQEPKSPEGEE